MTEPQAPLSTLDAVRDIRLAPTFEEALETMAAYLASREPVVPAGLDVGLLAQVEFEDEMRDGILWESETTVSKDHWRRRAARHVGAYARLAAAHPQDPPEREKVR